MSQYSELMGSFIRTGNYPIEADYIFSSEQELKDFYAIPENYAILHKGLLKVVITSEELTLYWVTKKQTNDELEFTKLVSSTTVDQIDDIINLLNKEIEDRKTADLGIYGTLNVLEIPEEHNTILKIALKLREVASLDDINVLRESINDLLNQLNTLLDWKANFLDGLDENSTLKDIIVNYISQYKIIPVNNDVVELASESALEGTKLSAKLNLSNADGNQLIKKTDGLYYNLQTEYNDGILTLKVNDYIISQHILGLSAIVESAKYDSTLEAIIIVFKLLSGDKQEVVIPAGNLIREWEVDNSNSSKVVELTKEEVYGGGADKLSADVRIASDKYNILTKKENSLYVEGTSSNIIHDGDVTVHAKLTEIDSAISELKSDLDSIGSNTGGNTGGNTEINLEILPEGVSIETSPDLSDDSNKVPTTNWVRSVIEEFINWNELE